MPRMHEPFSLKDFLDESNRIEDMGPASPALYVAATAFLAKTAITVDDMIGFVKVVQPNAVIRDKPHLSARVGDYDAPSGGPAIVERLDQLLTNAVDTPMLTAVDAYMYHNYYEVLHPFTDGNGCSGRILWLWMMGGIKDAPLGFLHHFYYQALAHSRANFAPAE